MPHSFMFQVRGSQRCPYPVGSEQRRRNMLENIAKHPGPQTVIFPEVDGTSDGPIYCIFVPDKVGDAWQVTELQPGDGIATHYDFPCLTEALQ